MPRSDDPAQQDQLLRQWQASALAKYPSLKQAYGYLLGCWMEYHPKQKDPGKS